MALTGARLWQQPFNEQDLRYDAIGNNSVSFGTYDIVTFSSGKLVIGTAPTVGVVLKTQTTSSTNTTIAKVKPGYIPVTLSNVWLMGTNSDLTGDATDVGTYYNITGGSQNQVVNVTAGVTTGSSRAVQILRVDPRGIGGTGAGSGLRECLVKFVQIGVVAS